MKTVNELIEDLILKEHNFFAYQQIQDLIERGTKRVGLVQATGTGKAFLAIQLLYDNCLMKDDKKYCILHHQNQLLTNLINICWK